MRCANPSTMAVLPTPGWPINTGLFLVRRCSTCNVRLISSSLPMTGSSFPCSARSVRSTVYLSSAWRTSSAFCSFTDSPPRICSMADFTLSWLAPKSLRIFPNAPLSSMAARMNNSEEMYLSDIFCACLSHKLSTRPDAADN